MKTLFSKDPHQHVFDFISAVIDSEQLTSWLENLEREPDSLRLLNLAEMKNQMINNNEPQNFIDIVELLNNSEILHAINNVIRDARSTGMKIKKNNHYKTLISLIATTS